MKGLTEETVHPASWDFLSDIAPGEQHEWEMEYIHQGSGEKRWFHTVGLCSEVRFANDLYFKGFGMKTSNVNF